ncbi:MAG: T9SS type A sorting domain-containing protein [Hymenobacter sp.]|nr:MAG: T9SS type A sorting domain-containing protein [Hymenobacter sp.]
MYPVAGMYQLKNVASSLYADIANCDEAAGTALGLEASSALNCQTFRLDRTASGTYVLAAYYGNRPVEVPGAATTDGAALKLGTFSGGAHQYWAVQAVGTVTATRSALEATLAVFPNPASGGTFSLQLPAGTRAVVTVADLSGRQVYRQVLFSGSSTCELAAGLLPGAYLVQVATATDVATRKLLVL